MNPDEGFEERQRERKVRRRVFHLIFAVFALISGGFLIWKLSSLVLPIIVGALLAFLFLPVKERFKDPVVAPRASGVVFFAALDSSSFSLSTRRANIFWTTNRGSNSRYG
jgi:hypothetical protein